MDAPQWLAMFLHRVGFVFTEDSELEIGKKILDPAIPHQQRQHFQSLQNVGMKIKSKFSNSANIKK